MTVRPWPRDPVTTISDEEAESSASAVASCAKAGAVIAAAMHDTPISSLLVVFMVLLLNTEKCSPDLTCIIFVFRLFRRLSCGSQLSFRRGGVLPQRSVGRRVGKEV